MIAQHGEIHIEQHCEIQIQTDSDRFRQIQTDSDRFRQIQTDLDRFRQIQTDSDRLKHLPHRKTIGSCLSTCVENPSKIQVNT